MAEMVKAISNILTETRGSKQLLGKRRPYHALSTYDYNKNEKRVKCEVGAFANLTKVVIRRI